MTTGKVNDFVVGPARRTWLAQPGSGFTFPWESVMKAERGTELDYEQYNAHTHRG